MAYHAFGDSRGPMSPYGNWHDGSCDVEDTSPGGGGGEEAGEGKILTKELVASIFGSGCIAALSIPALIGAWCWPAVLAASLGPAFQRLDGMGSRRLAHTLMFALNLASFASLLTFVALKTPAKRGGLPCLEQWGPFLGLVAAALLVMVDLTRHILLDAGLFIAELHMFNMDGSLTVAGRTGMYSTWVGNALLLAGLVWYVLPARRPAQRGGTPPLWGPLWGPGGPGPGGGPGSTPRSE